MRIEFWFSAFADRPVSATTEGTWALPEHSLGMYLDQELADLGIVGGEVTATVTSGRASIRVDFWTPEAPSARVIDELLADVVGQLDDGCGEGGFCVPNTSAGDLLLFADTDAAVRIELFADERIIAPPSAVAISAREGDIERLRAVLQTDCAEVDGTLQGYTGLHLAILYGRVSAVELLIGANANVNARDPNGETPLTLCALSRALDDEASREVAEMLLRAGASLGRTEAKAFAKLRNKQRLFALL